MLNFYLNGMLGLYSIWTYGSSLFDESMELSAYEFI